MPKPSFGCALCRRRKIKCDERAGQGCLNCEFYGANCPGYPSRIDVVFRNRIVQLPDDTIPQLLPPNLLNFATHSPWLAHIHPSLYDSLDGQRLAQTDDIRVEDKIERPLLIDRESVKLGLFYSMWCTSDSPALSIDELHIYGNGCLYAAVDILSAEAMHHSARKAWQIQRLHSKYCHALNLVQSALDSPKEASEDHVMIAVLLLGTIEAKISPQRAVKDWVTHVKGASDLLQFRGPDQVSTTMGAALYLQASTQLFTTCLLTGLALPDQYIRLSKQVLQRVPNPQDVIWRHHEAMVTFVHFVCCKAVKAARCLNYPDAACDIVLRALQIHRKLEIVFDNAATIWEYEIVETDHGLQHTYSSCLAAQLWNSTRVATIILFDIVVIAASYFNEETWHSLTPSQTRQMHNAKEIIGTAASDVLVSIPQQMAFMRAQIAPTHGPGAIPSIARWSTTQVLHYVAASQSQHMYGDDKLPVVMFNGGLWCFMAAYFAALSHNIDESTRRTLCDVLMVYRDEMHVTQAAILLDNVLQVHRKTGQQ